jgi:hypothetical protein
MCTLRVIYKCEMLKDSVFTGDYSYCKAVMRNMFTSLAGSVVYRFCIENDTIIETYNAEGIGIKP